MSANIHGINDGPSQRATAGDKNKPSSDPFEGLECLICVEKPVQPVMTKWGHVFCYACIDNWLKRTVGRIICPTCREPIDRETLEPILGNVNVEADNRYNTGPAEQLTPLQWIWKSIVLIFTSGFGLLPALKFLNLGRYFGDGRRRNPNEPYFEGETERKMKIGITLVLVFLIFLKLFG